MSTVPSSPPEPAGTGPLTPVVKSGAAPAIAPRTFWQRVLDGLRAAWRAFVANYL